VAGCLRGLGWAALARAGWRPGLAREVAPPGGLLGPGDARAVLGADAREVVVRIGPQERRRIPWAQLAPRGAYVAREALAPPADGEARRALAELAADLGLWAEARAEYEKALALGALDAEAFALLVARAEEAAVEQGVQHARTRAEAGDVAGALEVARELKLAFGTAPNAGRIRALVEELLASVRAADEQAAAEAAELARLQDEARKARELLERRVRAEERIAAGDAAAARAAEAREQGALTRARKAAEEADQAWTEARRQLGRLRRILPPEDLEGRARVASRLDDLDRKQFALRLAMARFFAAPGSRNYAQADLWARRAAFIDPVHPDLLELADQLVGARIRYRMSDVTNARPIVR
ncbi:MAG: hypothetical protein ACKOSS_09475, partial [Planctomycetia bacterium]